MNKKADILQALVEVLKSEAALYQYFPSKAHIFYSLITYIEKNLQNHINLIIQNEKAMFIRLRSIMMHYKFR